MPAPTITTSNSLSGAGPDIVQLVALIEGWARRCMGLLANVPKAPKQGETKRFVWRSTTMEAFVESISGRGEFQPLLRRLSDPSNRNTFRRRRASRAGCQYQVEGVGCYWFKCAVSSAFGVDLTSSIPSARPCFVRADDRYYRTAHTAHTSTVLYCTYQVVRRQIA